MDMLQKDYDKAKNDILKYCEKISEKDKELDEREARMKRDKDTIMTLENKTSFLKKEF